MMRILALVHRVPYPPNKGEKIRAYHELRHLTERGHRVDLATFADAEEDLRWARELAELAENVRVVRKWRKPSTVRAGLAVPLARPLSVGYFWSSRFAYQVHGWLRDHDYDVALGYSSPMAEYLLGPRFDRRPMARVMDFVDVDSEKWRQYAGRVELPMSAVYKAEAELLSRYERKVAREFDASILVSRAEAEAFRKIAPDARRIVDVPNGVDTEFFGATERRPAHPPTPLLVFVGQMDYFANVDAVRWFGREVFPKIKAAYPGARFRIVGRNPTEEVEDLKSIDGVEVTGPVPDVREHLDEATLVVAPLRIARGIQNKVLEAMAARAPVVASPAAFEGIEGEPDVHAAVADGVEAQVAAILALIADRDRRKAMAARARTLVEKTYAWGPAMTRLEDVLLEAAADARRRR